jgi:signal transduction histidine kinase
LPIVKSIAGFHDIEIDVISEKDKGSTFKLILPPTLIVVS